MSRIRHRWRSSAASGAALTCAVLATASLAGVAGIAAAPHADADTVRPAVETGAIDAGTGDTPAVEVTPASGLNPSGDTVTVAASGFAAVEPGIYLAFGPGGLAEPWEEDPATFPSVLWVHPGGGEGAQQAELRPDGTFDAELAVAAIAGVQSYAIYTFAAHGSADRSQDTTTPIRFASGPTSSPTPTDPPTSGPPSTPPTTPPFATPTGQFDEREVSSGLLEWGVKESFRSYISGPIARGGWTVHGVTETAGIFRWTSSSGDYDMDSRSGTVAFDGGVTFTGHDGALDITLSHPQVRLNGTTTATLLLDVRSRSLSGGGEVVQSAVAFASLDLSKASTDIGANTVGYVRIPASLTAAGAQGFGGFYEAGAALDSLTLRFAVGDANVPGGGSAGLAHTGASPGLAVGGVLLVVLGAGLVIAGRRRLATL